MMPSNVKLCNRCGKCCITNMYAYVVKQDIERWEAQGRHDIISHVQSGYIVWAGDRIVSSSGEDMSHCPFLKTSKGLCSCSIYETRPGVCINFKPGSSSMCPQWEGQI